MTSASKQTERDPLAEMERERPEPCESTADTEQRSEAEERQPNDDGSSNNESDLRAVLEARARSLGFVRFGVAPAEPLADAAEHLDAWLAAGRHGEMSYMERTRDVRVSPTHPGMLPGARSVIVLVTPYARERERVGPAPGRVARYARGRDYHNVVRKRADKLVRLLREQGHGARAGVDSLPIFERAWAERAGVGFIGKNCCLIVPGHGSHVFLSAIVTTAALFADAPIRAGCGSCRLCLDACPTGAFVGARELDARRCISYLTIESRSAIPTELRPRIGDWVFGCDVCQDVCPYNRTALPPNDLTESFAADSRWTAKDAAAVLELHEDGFAEYAHGSPLRRAGRDGLLRNVAVMLGNVGQKRHLPVLQRCAEEDPSPVVAEAARWAADQIRSRDED